MNQDNIESEEESYFDWIHEIDWEWGAIGIETLGIALFIIFGPYLLAIWPLELLGYVVWLIGFAIWMVSWYDW